MTTELSIIIVVRGILDVRTQKMATALANSGAHVEVLVMIYRDERRSEKVDGFAVTYIPLLIRGSSSKHPWRPWRVFCNLMFFNPLVHIRALFTGAFGEVFIVNELSIRKPEVIVAINADTIGPCGKEAQKQGAMLVYDAHEFWPDYSREELIGFTRHQRHVLRSAERNYMPQADLSITVSPVLARDYKEELDLPVMPLVIYNSPLECIPTPAPANNPLKFVFLGSLQTERNVKLIFEAAAITEGVDMSFQGFGELESWLCAEIRKRGLQDRIRVVAPSSYDDLIDSASSYDIGILAHEGYNRQMQGALPNKFFEYMAAGLAVIVPPTQALVEFENIEDFADILPEVTIEKISEEMLRLVTDPDRVTAMKKAAVELAPRYSGDSQATHLREALSSIYQSKQKE